MALLTEKEVRAVYDKHRTDDNTFAVHWSGNDYDFYEWCSNYLDYQHIKNPQKEATNAKRNKQKISVAKSKS